MISIRNQNELNNFITIEKQDDEKLIYTFNYPCGNDYTVCFPFEITFSPGLYFLECWGSSGSTVTHSDGKVAPGGNGGYSSGVFIATKTRKLFLYIGGSANITSVYGNSMKSIFNGCLNEGSNYYDGAGGGATDFRTKGGEWNSSFDSRIIVAGGGGACRVHTNNYIMGNFKGGDGGGLEGSPGEGLNCTSPYGTQNQSYAEECNDDQVLQVAGQYGYGTSGFWGGGGGGYFGGSSVHNGAGGGGSGFIGDLESIGKYIAQTKQTIHQGFGYAKITVLTHTTFMNYFINTCKSKSLIINHIIFIIMILIK